MKRPFDIDIEDFLIHCPVVLDSDDRGVK